MKNFWKSEILEMAESEIFCVESGADHDAAIETWLRPQFGEIEGFPSRKMNSKFCSKYWWLMHFLESRYVQRRL